ncbi:MAG TPA: transcription elongation factor GreA [Candidatus Omnitrophota bacterium]|nr:transcription elongation factor GreA [Candidatus Omnitrophota bacterium]HPS20182.1 transcription elongation factor GreA [Candidatus Omnitrophota bacterium]
MAGGKVVLTREGYSKLAEELEFLRGEKRRQIVKDIQEAREKGDLSENAEYDAAKEAQAHNEKKIAELQDVLSRAQILEHKAGNKEEVLIGMTVTVKDKDTGEEIDYILVSEEESDFEQNKISVSSPVGRSLVGLKIGDIAEVKIPAGVIQYEILKIKS